jgi:lysyl-tRNA synthetase, class I
VRKLGRKTWHIHVVDNFDPLRKRYEFLPERFDDYVGQPICLIPDPLGDCHSTYAEHFYQEFELYTRQMSVVPDQVVRSYEDLYAKGRMSKHIEQALEKAVLIRKILEKTSNRQLAADWTPVQAINPETGKFFNASIEHWDRSGHTINGVPYDQGKAKLNWRLDWPARWAELGVMVEPFSAQEHGAAGGSYDTGAQFASEVFGINPPIPGVQYANIHLVGDTKKMSSSKGNLITPKQALEIMPPEILRYFIVRSRPDRTLYFDSGVGLYNLIDEYSKVQEAVLNNQPTEFREAYEFASLGVMEPVISRVSFNHLVSVYQAAGGDTDLALKTLDRTGYAEAVKTQSAVLRREFSYVSNWLQKYAPSEVKFSVQDRLPGVELSNVQRQFLAKLAQALAAESSQPDGQSMHNLIYSIKEELGLKPADAFRAIYQVILGQDSGPKAGWFLASLPRDWLLRRLALEA